MQILDTFKPLFDERHTAALGRSRRFGRTRGFRSTPVNGHSQDRRALSQKVPIAAIAGSPDLPAAVQAPSIQIVQRASCSRRSASHLDGRTSPATRRGANETIDDARALIDELLTAHPDIAARDFLTHPGKPGHVNPADADVVAEKVVGGLRLHCLDGFARGGLSRTSLNSCRFRFSLALLFSWPGET